MVHYLLTDNPGTVFLAVFAVVMYGLSRRQLSTHSLQRVALVCGGVAVCAYTLIVLANIVRGGLLWHDAANTLSIAAAVVHGQPMYTVRGGPAFYSLFYGPYTPLLYVPFLVFAKNPFPWIRLAVSAADLLSVIVLFQALRRWVRPAAALALLSMAAAVLLARPNELLGFRADPWILLGVCVVLLVLTRSRGGVVVMVPAGLVCGVAVDLKITLLPVTGLLLYALYRRWGMRVFAVALPAFVLAATGVFLLPNISFANYIAALQLSTHQLLLRSTLLQNLVVAAMLLVPAMVWLREGGVPLASLSKDRGMVTAGALAFVVCVVTGSKDSAGFWHLWPMLPVALVGTAYLIRQQTVDVTEPGVESSLRVRSSQGKERFLVTILAATAVAGAAASVTFAAKDAAVLLPLMRPAWKLREIAALTELQRIAHAPHVRNLSMGYGSDVTDYRSNLRYVLPLAGEQYFFDENEVVESIKERMPVPANVMVRILSCQDDWLIPHGETPFSALRVRIMTPGDSPYIFPAQLREGFVQTHRLAHEGPVFDVWACKAG